MNMTADDHTLLLDGVQTASRGYSHWLCTWNNYPEDWFLKLQAAGPTFIQAQKEVSTTGTPHIQFYLWYEKPTSRKAISKKLPQCALFGKPPAASKAVYLYCTPSKGDPEDNGLEMLAKRATVVLDSAVAFGKKPSFQLCTKKTRKEEYDETLTHCKKGQWELAEPEHQVKYLGNLTKLTAHYAVGQDADAPRGTWIYGPPGGGKSYFARHHYGSPYYLKGQNKWWDNYGGEPTVILDDLDHQGQCLSHHLKIWLDQYAFKGEIKGSSVAVRYTNFIITSNYQPEDLWPSDAILVSAIRRRCKFIEFNNRVPVDKVPTVDTFAVALNTFLNR